MSEIKQNGAPDKNTAGMIGDICIDNLTGNKYKLESVITITGYHKTSTHYDWKLMEPNSSSSGESLKTLIDTETGDTYMLEVTNGKLTLKEA